jgi:hypothetical protein
MSRVVGIAAALCIAALNGVVAAQTPPSAAAQRVRVGVYDSRMVALAYYNSDEHRRLTRDLMAQLKAAKAANDTAKIADLEFRGPALQNLMHYQVFSTASIPNVMEKLAPELPGIAAEARVSVIVSKWDVAFHGSGVEYVDVTDALAARFNPNERVRQWIAEGRTKQPLPLLEAVMTLRPER